MFHFHTDVAHHKCCSITDPFYVTFSLFYTGLLKRKSSSGRDLSNSNSPESSDSDYSNGTSSVSKRLHVDNPLTLPTATPSAMDILTRAFPSLSSAVLEHVLKGCSGNVLQAIEVIVQYNASRPLTNGMLGQSNILPAQPPSDNNAQAPPPPPPHAQVSTPGSMPPLFKFNYVNGQYRYLMPPSLMPLTSYMLPQTNGLGLPFHQFPVELQNHPFKPADCAPEPDVHGDNVNGDAKPVINGYTTGVCKACGQETNQDESLCPNCSASFNRK